MTQPGAQHTQIHRIDTSNASWKKASGSSNNGGCVEVAVIGGMVAVRDSKNPQLAPHLYTRDEFRYFLDGAKAGEFDEFA
jgi:hypothetical protein